MATVSNTKDRLIMETNSTVHYVWSKPNFRIRSTWMWLELQALGFWVTIIMSTSADCDGLSCDILWDNKTHCDLIRQWKSTHFVMCRSFMRKIKVDETSAFT